MAKTPVLVWILGLSLAASAYFGWSDYRLNRYNLSLQREIASTTGNFNSLKQEFEKTEAERTDFERKYNGEKTRADSIEIQFGAVKDTIGVLEKLYAIDSELLKKYSKVYFLNENYTPSKLIEINPEYIYNSPKKMLFLEKIYPHLQELMADAQSQGVDIKILSAYRSFGEQSILKSSYSVIYGSGANSFSADQGYSEHQLGTTIDFTTAKFGEILASFEKAPAYQWLLNNAYKYGFIISYPKNNAYYKFEPWHWRFIGKDFAGRLHDDNKNFYDLDQRLIDTYLLSFFD